MDHHNSPVIEQIGIIINRSIDQSDTDIDIDSSDTSSSESDSDSDSSDDDMYDSTYNYQSEME